MNFGINTFLFTSPFTNDSTRLFAQYKKWGFDSVEIPIEDPSHIDPRYVREQLNAHDLICGSICGCMGPDRDLRGTLEQQEAAFRYLMAIMDQMKPLGSRVLCGPLYSSVGHADVCRCRQPRPRHSLRYFSHEHRREEPAESNSQSGHAHQALPRLRQ